MLRAEGPYHWLAILLGYPILGVWYWCSDQTIVQRVPGANSELNSQDGPLFAGLPKITPVFLMAAVTVLSLGLSIAFCLFLVDTKQVAGSEWISDDRVGLGSPLMMQAVYMFVIWSGLYVVVSIAAPAPPREQAENTTWPNPLAVVFRGRLIGWHAPRLLTAVLLIFTLVLYWVFR